MGPVAVACDIEGQSLVLITEDVRCQDQVCGTGDREEFGEAVFTEFGMTGPAVLTLSSAAVDSLRSGDKVTFAIDLKPALDERKLDSRLRVMSFS